MLNTHRPYGPYERYSKRPLYIACAVGGVVCFWWLFAIIALLVRIKLGSPVLFTQQRPGKDEKIFKLYKFRTMTDEKDKNGQLLPDDIRLTKFGKFLRATSLDELPEIFNILKGEMSVVGPRPQLVRDMVFMSAKHRERHAVRPGLTGLAQINGRNDIDWQDKLDWDLKYIAQITFWGDVKIIAKTFVKSFIKPEGITEQNAATATDYGDYLLQQGKVTQEEYQQKQQVARILLGGHV